ncbi:ABC transporter ATP-binding protein [Candidatus Bathyarchaeota archaeon]|nr:MAG: ABC transporter ATP-binding protein [Candidatus Bathyarchaeota archaeon]
MPVLQVEHLTTNYKTLRGWVKACEDVNFQVEKGEAMGLVGESGCGKTTVALSLLKLLPSAGRIRKGRILFNGNDLVKMSDSQIRKIRWKGIAIVFQGAMNALNPVFKISDQITEAIKIHEPHVSRTAARERVESLLEMVGIDSGRADNYPHEFSGGMRQRALIAMALAANPEVLVADEPGTALDVVVQAQILKLLRELKDKLNLSMVFISHDLSIVAETCDKLAIMYAGQVIECGDTKSIFAKPLHPYTQGLLGAFPSIKGERKKLVSIPGQPPDLLDPPSGCRFNPRCPYVMDICKKVEPKLLPVDQSNHLAHCHLYPQE